MMDEKVCPRCKTSLIEHLGFCTCDLDFCHGQRCGASEKRGKLFCPKCNLLLDEMKASV